MEFVDLNGDACCCEKKRNRFFVRSGPCPSRIWRDSRSKSDLDDEPGSAWQKIALKIRTLDCDDIVDIVVHSDDAFGATSLLLCKTALRIGTMTCVTSTGDLGVQLNLSKSMPHRQEVIVDVVSMLLDGRSGLLPPIMSISDRRYIEEDFKRVIERLLLDEAVPFQKRMVAMTDPSIDVTSYFLRMFDEDPFAYTRCVRSYTRTLLHLAFRFTDYENHAFDGKPFSEKTCDFRFRIAPSAADVIQELKHMSTENITDILHQ